VIIDEAERLGIQFDLSSLVFVLVGFLSSKVMPGEKTILLYGDSPSQASEGFQCLHQSLQPHPSKYSVFDPKIHASPYSLLEPTSVEFLFECKICHNTPRQGEGDLS
jgi:hypothetical protein